MDAALTPRGEREERSMSGVSPPRSRAVVAYATASENLEEVRQ